MLYFLETMCNIIFLIDGVAEDFDECVNGHRWMATIGVRGIRSSVWWYHVGANICLWTDKKKNPFLRFKITKITRIF